MKGKTFMNPRILTTLTGALLSVVLLAPAVANAGGGVTVDGQLSDWAALFNADGSVITGGDGVPAFAAHGGQDANFVWDEVSGNGQLDFTALTPGNARPVKNGMVTAKDDVARAYFYVEPNADGDNIYYIGLERVAAGDSHIEIELNQEHRRLGHGSPWKIDGASAAGDALVRLSFVGAELSVSVQRAIANADGIVWDTLVTTNTPGCDGFVLCVARNADTISGGGPWSSYENADPGQTGSVGDLAAGTFVELSINVRALLGSNVNLASAQVRTPEDIAFGYFGEGSWGGN